MRWTRVIDNADSPYPEDRRVRYVSGKYEVQKHADGYYWVRRNGEPLGMSHYLRGAKACAEHHRLVAAKVR